MTIEEKLRAFILNRYCSMNNFCNEVGLLPQTMSAILRKGITTCSSGNLFKICDALGISIDYLRKGEIVPLINNDDPYIDIMDAFVSIAKTKDFTIDGVPLNRKELHVFSSNLELSINIIKNEREMDIDKELDFDEFEF